MSPRRSPCRTARFLRVVLATLILAPLACGTEAVQGGAQCTYLQVISCIGPGSCEGTRTCLPDLSVFTSCECADGATWDAAPDGDAG